MAKGCLESKARPSDRVVEEASAEAVEVHSAVALVAMFAVMGEDQRSFVGFEEADLTFDADRRETSARGARQLDKEPAAVVPGTEVEEEPHERGPSPEAAPAAAVEGLGEVEAHYHI